MAKPQIISKKHSILTYMVQQCGTKVTKALLKKRIDELRPESTDSSAWTVDAFLKQNETTILSDRQGRSNEWVYFPEDRSPTRIDNWDLSATIYILLNTCNVNRELRMYLQDLRKLRNKLVHMANLDIDETKFEIYMTKVNITLEKFVAYIGDEQLAQESESMIQNATDWSTFDDSKEGQPPENRETKTTLEKDATSFDETTNKKLDTTIKVVKQIENKVGSDNPLTDVPDAGIVISVHNCDREKAVVISEHLVGIFNDVIDKKYDEYQDMSNEHRHKVREAVYETCLIFLSRGRPIYKAEVECVLLKIRCISFAALLTLFRDYINGILDGQLKQLESAVRRCDGYEKVSLEVKMYKDDFWDILSRIANDVEKYVSTKEKRQASNGKRKYVSDSMYVPLPARRDGMEEYMEQQSSHQGNEGQAQSTPLSDTSKEETSYGSIETKGSDSSGEYV